ncbi:nucleotide exchange factor GrpE [Plasticicumulans acidivorans]|uniref:Protein GrpE n=1 Tax=Plasticicumulans acidivorans TaxID=886464 RepID=A0A317MSZ5_9GAMM|nr:nucleotide exchange factor GrpE [Plasticicumulans acidivorans]PWV60494.1 molecular chaperone GrpE [Plasticicumulans acidivorans]
MSQEQMATQAAAENVSEAPADELPVATAEQEIENLKQELSAAQAKAEEHWNEFLATRAEMENLRRRNERDLAAAHKFALEKFFNELLPVRDSLEMGIQAAVEGADFTKLREGSEMTLKILETAMGKFGMVTVDPQGEKFNPDQHEALAMAPVAEVEPNTVIQVVQKGYMLNDRLVRPAKVIVAKAP